jgi:hypothetical protein
MAPMTPRAWGRLLSFRHVRIDCGRLAHWGRTFSEVTPQSRITLLACSASGFVELTALGQAITNYLVLANRNLNARCWEMPGSATASTNGLEEFTDLAATTHPMRFYRLLAEGTPARSSFLFCIQIPVPIRIAVFG